MARNRLELDDIADIRAYERERDGFRARIIALKRLRRVLVGPIVSLVFENRDTIRFQIQEMARAERLGSDAAIQAELDTYNPLIPEPGRLAATMFIELTSKAQMEEWLPRLVGIERSVELRLAGGDEPHVVRGRVDERHAAQLTREEVTPAVHYVHFSLTLPQVERFRAGQVALAVQHPHYRHLTDLSEDTRASLARDLVG